MASFAERVPLHNGTNMNGVKRSSWTDPRGPPAHANDRAFPHLSDIIASAQTDFDPSKSPNEYLKELENCLNLSRAALNLGNVDRAFKEYLKASEIAVNLIPKHKDYGFFEFQPGWGGKFKSLRSTLDQMFGQMEGVKRIIEDNNARHNTVPRTGSSGQNPGMVPGQNTTGSRPSSSADDRSNGAIGQFNRETSRPQSVPKPQSLRASSHNTNDLTQRFAKLRTASDVPSSLAMPDEKPFPPTNAVPSTMAKPLGPREMHPASLLPAIPPKVSLQSTMLPKPPDPTYNVQSSYTSTRQPHENHRPPTERKQTYYGQPIAPATSLHLQRTKEEYQPYRPRTPNGVHHAIIPKSNSIEIPHSTTISAETLSEYITKYNILIVDIRDRTSFDEGHIFATSILCIEPLSLKEGTSAEALEERLVLSPDNEQTLFSRRNEFDLVVYYDQSTSDISYLRGSPTMNRTPHLRAFHDTLYEFNEYKPLKDGRPPALLQGGLDAWIDLMGPQCLATSRTAAMLGSTRQRHVSTPSRSIGRQRIASTNSRFEVRDRRLRNHKFLDESEQQAWRQQAQQEQVTTNDTAQVAEEGYGEEAEEYEEPPSPFVPDYETFLRRFPAVEQQSMTMPPRRAVIPPRKFDPPPLPMIPSRPPPAAPRPSYSGQAEIIQPQAPLARVASSTKQPLYSSSLALRSRKVPRTGLTNFGVTCYMNSTLQCLSSTIPLATFFMEESAYKRNVQKNWKGSSGIMPEIFANVLRSLWKGDVDVIKPTTFRKFCGRMNREWVIDRQQDAKEFFDFLVDCLHEDLNVNWECNPLKPLTTEQELHRETYKIPDASAIEWARYEHRDRSFISSLFAGQHASRLKCLTCRGTSTTYEPFYSISIEIPRSGQGDIYRCLESYTKEEKLAPDERWRCPYCKTERDATKQIILTRLPQFLVIHFKRFSASKTESARKIHTPIDFPLHGLSMDPFVVAAPPKHDDIQAQSSQLDPTATTPPFTYDTYGVLRHLGNSIDSGHYISIVKDPGRGCWRKFDDERHYEIDPAQLSTRDKLQSSEAYIVFFQRSHPR